MVSDQSDPSALEELDSLPECPVCHRGDRVEKASGILRRNSGHVSLGDSPVSYRFTSAIATEFAAPPHPTAPTWPSTAMKIFASLAVVIVIGASYYVARNVADLDIPRGVEIGLAALALWFGILGPIKTLAETVYRRQNAERSLPGWQAARTRWESLYYCVRDDVGFVKGAPDWRTPERVKELLFLGGTVDPNIQTRAQTSDLPIPTSSAG